MPQLLNHSENMQQAVQAAPKVPGQHALHYSPRTPLRLYKDRQDLLAACDTQFKANKTCAALLIGEGQVPDCEVTVLPEQPQEVAERLYSALHALDALKVDRLLVELPPQRPEWLAVLDRLTRAGHR